MSFHLTSAAFAPGERIPVKYTGEGVDVSPPLAWQGSPPNTREFALLCDDPDAPTPQPWVHWILMKIPGDVSQLPEDLPRRPELANPAGALQGVNSWPAGENLGYRGPMPPAGHGVHHYHFRLFALKTPLPALREATKEQLLEALDGQVLAESELIGTYERKKA
jgi:Raf kinase inhibitor-like YbhB/YbcL family protein